MSQILNSVSDFVTVLDPAGRIIFISQNLVQTLQAETGRLPKKFGELARLFEASFENGDPITKRNSVFSQAVLTKKACQKVFCAKSKRNNHTRWISAKSLPVLNEHGDVLLVVNVYQDITYAKKKERQLEKFSQRAISALEETLD